MDSSHHFNDIVLYGVNIKCCYLYLKSYIWLVRNFFLSVLCSFGVCVAFFMLNHTHHRYEIYIQDSKLWKTTNTVFCARRATTLSASNQNGGKSLLSISTFRIEFNCGILVWKALFRMLAHRRQPHIHWKSQSCSVSWWSPCMQTFADIYIYWDTLFQRNHVQCVSKHSH